MSALAAWRSRPHERAAAGVYSPARTSSRPAVRLERRVCWRRAHAASHAASGGPGAGAVRTVTEWSGAENAFPQGRARSLSKRPYY
jgi:hypothetical protein